jgi:monoamine oxidase
MTELDVVIVGGGAAGVAAARRLSGRGLSTRLIESAQRLGGRAWTHEIGGFDLDMGAGWLHSAERNSWARIAREAGVPLEQRRAAWGAQFENKGFPPQDQANAWRAFKEWTQRLANAPPPSDCAADALEQNEWNPHIRSIVGFISGAPLEQLSAADYVAYDNASTEQNWRSRRGYGSLITSSFPLDIPLSLANPVKSISLDGRRVVVATRAGDLRARAVILTMSTHVLAGDTLLFPRELDAWRSAAKVLPLGHNEKLFLEIIGDAPFAEETHVTGDPHNPRTGSYYIRPFGLPVIECFLGGDSANILTERGGGAALEFALDQLTALFGGNVRDKLRPLAASNWSRMLRIGGAYSYALPGHANARAELARPFDDRIFFAGEATSAADFTTAHGAHDSGVRAADEALKALGVRAAT